MKTINIRELRENLKDYIGKEVAITKHEKIVAYLMPPEKVQEPKEPKEPKKEDVSRFNRFEACPKHGGFKQTCGCK